MKHIKLLSILTAVLFLNSACRQDINEVYLIPRGFTGNIAVVFDVKQGEKEELENGRRVYRIPADGILITQASFNSTLHDEKFFFGEGGGRVPIPSVVYADAVELQRMDLSDDDLFVRFNGSAGGNNQPGYSRHYAGSRRGMDASTEDFGFSEPLNLDARVKAKLEKLRGEKIFE